jgi:putative colanic acid biosynthesis acetyltransferase WcaF
VSGWSDHEELSSLPISDRELICLQVIKDRRSQDRSLTWVFDSSQFDRGRSRLMEALWQIVQTCFVSSNIPGSAIRVALLKLFGAEVGSGVRIKPRVRIKFPWKLTVGDNVWLGEGAWIDNLDQVKIGSNSCISQGAYLCTGSHDWGAAAFDLITGPINIEPSAWIAANATVGPGVTVREGAVLALGSTAVSDLEPWCVYIGAPAALVRRRRLCR